MDSKNFSAILIPSILAIIIGAILLVVGIFVTSTVSNAASVGITPVAASGTLSWAGNSSCGNIVNVTNASGARASFYVNVTGADCAVAPAGYAYINVSKNSNTSIITAQNTTIAFNANVTVNQEMVATNVTNGTTLTYSTTGTGGNAVLTTETGTNSSWTSGTLTGGVNGNQIYSSALSNADSNVSAAFTLLGVILIVGGAGGIILVLFGFPGIGGGRRE